MKITYSDIVSDDNVEQIVGMICFIEDNNGNIFIGDSNCDPEDMEYFSTFMAGDLARWRAFIEKNKYEKRELTAKIKFLENFKDEMLKSSKVDPKSVEMKKVYRKIKILKRDRAVIETEISKLKEAIVKKIANKQDFTEKLKSIRGIAPSQPFIEKTKAVLGGELK